MKLILFLGAAGCLYLGALTYEFTHHQERAGRRGETFSAMVVGVTDGDTIKVRRLGAPLPVQDKAGRQSVTRQMEGPELRIRLWGIDAPEKKQPFGAAAKKRLSDLVFQRVVGIEVRDVDRYGRLVAWVTVESREAGGAAASTTHVNALMVVQGYAWWYRHYAPKDETLSIAEDQARKLKVGLWSEAGAMAPWEWRKG